MKIRNLYVKQSREAILIGEDGETIASGPLSQTSLLQLHLQVLQALLRGEDLDWEQIEKLQDFL